VADADVAREKMKTDVTSLLGGDIYSLLRQRHDRATSRFSAERDEGRALKERQRCLVKLKKELDIPDEVLAALPGADVIQAKFNERLTAAGEPGETAGEAPAPAAASGEAPGEASIPLRPAVPVDASALERAPGASESSPASRTRTRPRRKSSRRPL
ncbi:MAG: hypothetical protein AAF725_26115, partial [Acidobacteriota bacterium]